MKDTNILILEDESIVAMEIESYVKKLGYTVVANSSNAEDAFSIVQTQVINIILMDICIKGDLDGVSAAEHIKKSHPDIEIIFLTAHLDDYNVDRAIGVNPAAYLSKPFNREELRVSLKIAMHKIAKNHVDVSLHEHYVKLDNEFAYDPSNHTLFCCHEIIHLTKKENALLGLLIDNKNALVSVELIEYEIWPDKEITSNTIRSLVKRLRQKLNHKFIQTVSSRGYKIITL